MAKIEVRGTEIRLHPYFKYGEFDLIKSRAGLNKGMMDNSKAEFEEWMPAHKVIRGLLYTFDDNYSYTH